MGTIDDTRKAVQDFIAPDPKAMAVRLEALENGMSMRFDHVGSEFANADKMNQERLSTLQKYVDAQFDLLMATMASNHASIMTTWEMEKRLTRLESERKVESRHA